MKTIQYFFLTALISMLIFGCSEEAPTPEPELPTAESSGHPELEPDFSTGDTLAQQVAEPFYSISLENGNSLKFFYFSEGTDKDVLVMEAGTCSSCSALGAIEDTTATALDIFWAFSEPGVAVPLELSDISSKPLNERNQGWARGLASEASEGVGLRAEVACNNVSFGSSIPGGFLPGYTFRRYDKRPGSYSAFKTPDYWRNGQFYGVYYYNAQYNTRRWRGKVCVRSHGYFAANWCGYGCSQDPYCQSSGYCTDFLRPQINFQRKNSNGTWSDLGSVLAPAYSLATYGWWVNGSSQRSYRINIRYAKANDEFDIMMDQD